MTIHKQEKKSVGENEGNEGFGPAQLEKEEEVDSSKGEERK